MTQRNLSISSPDEHTGEAPEPSREDLAADVLADEVLATAQGLSHEQGDNPGKPVGSFLLDWLSRYNAQLGLGSGTAAGFGLDAGFARHSPSGAGSDLHQNRNAPTPSAIGDKSP
jgi:hypothetical protein